MKHVTEILIVVQEDISTTLNQTRLNGRYLKSQGELGAIEFAHSQHLANHELHFIRNLTWCVYGFDSVIVSIIYSYHSPLDHLPSLLLLLAHHHRHRPHFAFAHNQSNLVLLFITFKLFFNELPRMCLLYGCAGCNF